MGRKRYKARDMLSHALRSCEADEVAKLAAEVGAMAGAATGNDPERMRLVFAGRDRKPRGAVAQRHALIVWLREEWCCTCYNTLHKRRILPRNVVEAEGLGRWKPLSWPIIAALIGMRDHTSALYAYRTAKGLPNGHNRRGDDGGHRSAPGGGVGEREAV